MKEILTRIGHQRLIDAGNIQSFAHRELSSGADRAEILRNGFNFLRGAFGNLIEATPENETLILLAGLVKTAANRTLLPNGREETTAE